MVAGSIAATLLAGGCTGGESGGGVQGGPSCALLATFRGDIYQGTTVAVAPVEGEPLGVAILPGCNDTGNAAGGERSSQIEVTRLPGVSPRDAVSWHDNPAEILIRSDLGRSDWPAGVATLMHPTGCRAADVPLTLAGPWLGILGADGKTEVDLVPPYDLDMLVDHASSARYERSFLTVHVPASLGRPLSHHDVRISLWKGGTITLRTTCNAGRYIATSVIAAAPP